MAYVGVVAWMLGVPLEVVEEALSAQFDHRQKLVESNMQVVRRAHTWASENLHKQDPFRLEPMNKTEGLIIMTGNEAGALGAVFGGVSVAAWYPITPSTSFMDALREFLPRLRKDENGHPTYAVIQAEDELAAAGIVMGAGWAGARALTATSGPGISLMAEFVSYGYFTEIPAVIWDIQRVGPSTGLPTRTSQGMSPLPTPWATATPNTPSCSPPPSRSASSLAGSRWIWPNNCKRRCLCSRTSIWA